MANDERTRIHITGGARVIVPGSLAAVLGQLDGHGLRRLQKGDGEDVIINPEHVTHLTVEHTRNMGAR